MSQLYVFLVLQMEVGPCNLRGQYIKRGLGRPITIKTLYIYIYIYGLYIYVDYIWIIYIYIYINIYGLYVDYMCIMDYIYICDTND